MYKSLVNFYQRSVWIILCKARRRQHNSSCIAIADDKASNPAITGKDDSLFETTKMFAIKVLPNCSDNRNAPECEDLKSYGQTCCSPCGGAAFTCDAPAVCAKISIVLFVRMVSAVISLLVLWATHPHGRRKGMGRGPLPLWYLTFSYYIFNKKVCFLSFERVN